MTISLVLWLMAWAGIFTGLYNLQPLPSLGDPLAFFQGARALLPVAAAYICLIWALATQARYRFGATTLGLFGVYGILGMIGSVAYSPDIATALYWGTVYLAPFLVAWFVIERPEPLPVLRNILRLNGAIVLFLLAAVLPEAFRYGFGRTTRYQIYTMPFGLGEVRANGVGRYALVVLIIAGVSLATSVSKKRFLWLPVVVPALFILMQTQSRSALLGLAVAGALFVFVRGIDLRFLVAGPVAAYAIWTSGVTWRAKGAWSSLVFLTGRDATWRKGLDRIGDSPFFGWGFHADRLLLDSEHMHNSYLHAAIQAGIPGALAFAAGVVVLWLFLWKNRVLGRINAAAVPDRALLMQAVLILGFFTARSFFESTGAFYGVDLLLIVPAVAYLYEWALENPVGTEEGA